MKPNQNTPTGLLYRLEQTGWIGLKGAHLRGPVGVLRALALILDDRRGIGRATIEEIAFVAQYSNGWVRRCLQRLEALELLEWQPGETTTGQPRRDHFRISISRLNELVAEAEGR